ncbi:hypothetical protein DPEC_G00152580 [Dallia pectoralis]|uniref:Uncharacterized protein n=1 Tax=Dallia pectoralis TaxID=75939 RepID=A0ACC2GJY8_DALPE|nr:hypothetical protein DPEC_G00152580 [Dallia pectoralis]
MSWTLLLAVLVLLGFLSLSADSQETCNKYVLLGESFEVPIGSDGSNVNDNDITWRLNGNPVLKTKKGLFSPGKKEDLSAKGSLLLKNVQIADGGLYEPEMFNDAGKSIKTTPYRLCVQGKVSKPTVFYKCSSESVAVTCNTSDNNVEITLKWNNIEQKSTDKPLTINLKDLKKSDTFTCSVKNKVSKVESDKRKILCDAVSAFPSELFGFDFRIMVGILAGGGGLVLFLILIILVCCCRRQRRRRCEEEREMRLDLLTQTQHPCHPDGQKQRPRPTEAAPPGSTGPRHMPRARERPPQTPKEDDDEEQAPPLPQPRKKGPRPPKQ